MVTGDSFGILNKLKNYICDIWNVIDMITIILFIVGLTVKICGCLNCLDISRIILTVNLITFYLRILHIFSLHKKLGPKLVMIAKMVSKA